MVLEYNALQKRRGPDFRLLLSYFRSTNNRLLVNQLCIELCTYRMFDRKSRDLDGMLSMNQLDSAMLPVYVSSVRLRNQEVWTSLTSFKSYSGDYRGFNLEIKRSGLLLPSSSHIQGYCTFECSSGDQEVWTLDFYYLGRIIFRVLSMKPRQCTYRVAIQYRGTTLSCTAEPYIKKARYSFQMCLLTFTKTKLPDHVSSLFQLCQHTLRLAPSYVSSTMVSTILIIVVCPTE